MVVTELKLQKRNRDRFSIYVDGDFFLGISANLVAKYGIYKGREIDSDELEIIKEAAIYERFWNRTVRYLEGRIRNEYQVRQYVRKLYMQNREEWIGKEVELDLPPIEGKIIDELLKFRLIDDRQYTEAYVRDRLKLKPRGSRLMIQELRAKGVDRELAEEIVNELMGDEVDLAEETLYRKYKVRHISQDDRKKIDFLRRRGFNWDQISKLVSK